KRSSLGGLLDQMAGHSGGNAAPSSHPETPLAGNTAIQQPEKLGKERESPKKKMTFEFDAAFAKQLKIQCAAEDISMRDYVVRAIHVYQAHAKPDQAVESHD
ncbi:MAG: hypothetical protein M1596_04270, partial [Firmicutes bacterium]|nr:hypothetical protein [Bacillota bacterium]